ncbi:MAG: hypothetical protein HY554_18935 [Elusimicrobia bacterium]|nr:hypothetical protein [Elusimicrobiota bacterium]
MKRGWLALAALAGLAVSLIPVAASCGDSPYPLHVKGARISVSQTPKGVVIEVRHEVAGALTGYVSIQRRTA